ncbi:MAG: twin-arginine translocase TatA/TatE family subunit [Acidobacteriota bacterium]
MFGLGGQELIVILAILLLIFGPKKLPQLGNALGRTIKGFRKGMKEAEDDVSENHQTPKSSG